MILNENAANPSIILVFGRLCSGKGTFCKQFPNHTHYTTSDFVKKISGFNTRDQLQTTGSLDQLIANEMIETIKSHDKVIIDGIRQKSIVQELIKHFGRQNIELIWLNAPADIRKQRYLQRSDKKDTKSFDDAEAGDSALGLDDLESQYKKISKQIDNF